MKYKNIILGFLYILIFSLICLGVYFNNKEADVEYLTNETPFKISKNIVSYSNLVSDLNKVLIDDKYIKLVLDDIQYSIYNEEVEGINFYFTLENKSLESLCYFIEDSNAYINGIVVPFYGLFFTPEQSNNKEKVLAYVDMDDLNLNQIENINSIIFDFIIEKNHLKHFDDASKCLLEENIVNNYKRIKLGVEYFQELKEYPIIEDYINIDEYNLKITRIGQYIENENLYLVLQFENNLKYDVYLKLKDDYGSFTKEGYCLSFHCLPSKSKGVFVLDIQKVKDKKNGDLVQLYLYKNRSDFFNNNEVFKKDIPIYLFRN